MHSYCSGLIYVDVSYACYLLRFVWGHIVNILLILATHLLDNEISLKPGYLENNYHYQNLILALKYNKRHQK